MLGQWQMQVQAIKGEKEDFFPLNIFVCQA